MRIIPVKVQFDATEMRLIREMFESGLDTQAARDSYYGHHYNGGFWAGIEWTLQNYDTFDYEVERGTVWFPRWNGGGSRGLQLNDIKAYFVKRGYFKGTLYDFNA